MELISDTSFFCMCGLTFLMKKKYDYKIEQNDLIQIRNLNNRDSGFEDVVKLRFHPWFDTEFHNKVQFSFVTRS